MSSTNEVTYIKLRETCKCKYRLDTSLCNNKQYWDEDKCRWECKNNIKDFRPISLLNVEGKLFFSILSKRLEKHIIIN